MLWMLIPRHSGPRQPGKVIAMLPGFALIRELELTATALPQSSLAAEPTACNGSLRDIHPTKKPKQDLGLAWLAKIDTRARPIKPDKGARPEGFWEGGLSWGRGAWPDGPGDENGLGSHSPHDASF